jgi:hypothetical protein
MCPITDRWHTCHGPVQRPLIKMADNSVSVCMEQRVVMKFLVNEGIKPTDIYRRLQGQYGDETLSRSKTFEWCKRFKDGRTSVSDFITTRCFTHVLTLLSAILINGLWTGPRHVRRLSVIGHTCHLLLHVVPPR